MLAKRFLVGSMVLSAATLVAGEARADWDTQIAADFSMLWLKQSPSVSDDAVATDARAMTGGDVKNKGGVTALGGSFDIAGTIDDRVEVPLIGLGVYGAIGPYRGVDTSVDGSIARLRPWTAYQIDLLLPGLGFRAKRRRWLFEGSLRTGVAWFEENGSIAAGAGERQIEPSRVGFLVLAHLDFCRRLDPLQRVCLDVTPRVYEFGFMNGVTAGIRWELGR